MPPVRKCGAAAPQNPCRGSVADSRHLVYDPQADRQTGRGPAEKAHDIVDCLRFPLSVRILTLKANRTKLGSKPVQKALCRRRNITSHQPVGACRALE